MSNNYFLRPEFFGGLLICRERLETWELDIQSMFFLWFYYHSGDIDESVNDTKKLLGEKVEIDSETVNFAIKSTFEIPTKWKCSGDKTAFSNEMLKNIMSITYLSSPIEISLYITNTCQLRCEFCFMNKQLDESSFIDLEKTKKIIDKFVDNGIQSISILGGEPLLHPQFLEICKYIEKKRVHYVVTTNGINIDEKTLAQLSELKYLALVFSIQSLDKMNQELTGVNFNVIMEKIKLAKKHDIVVRLNTVYSSQSKDQILSILKFALEMNIPRYSVAIYSDIGNKSIVSPSKDSLKSLNTYINDYLSQNGKTHAVNFAIEGCMFYSAYYEEETITLSEYEKLIYGCEAAQAKLDITVNFSAVSCMLLYEKGLYVENADEKSFEEIWNHQAFESLRNYKVSNEMCNNCNYSIFCNGGCFSNKEYHNGTFENVIDKKCHRLKMRR